VILKKYRGFHASGFRATRCFSLEDVSLARNSEVRTASAVQIELSIKVEPTLYMNALIRTIARAN
jgi:hypothetical protein